MSLTDTEAGRLAKALWQYTTTGKPPELSGNERGVFAIFQATLAQDDESSEDLSAKRSAAGKNGAKQKLANQANQAIARNAEANQAKAAIASIKNQSQIQNQNDNMDDDDDISRARTHGIITRAFQDALNRSPYPAETEKLATAANLLGTSPEMIALAISIAGERGAKDPAAYAKRILLEWQDEYITTPDEYTDYKFMADALAGRNPYKTENLEREMDAAREKRKQAHCRKGESA